MTMHINYQEITNFDKLILNTPISLRTNVSTEHEFTFFPLFCSFS